VNEDAPMWGRPLVCQFREPLAPRMTVLLRKPNWPSEKAVTGRSRDLPHGSLSSIGDALIDRLRNLDRIQTPG